MIDVNDRQPIQQADIFITLHMVSGDVFTQPIPIENLDYVQEFMDWYRNPGKNVVWAWHCVANRSIHLFKHGQIMAVDIEGYIEPDGRPSRWYEKVIDRIRVWRYV